MRSWVLKVAVRFDGTSHRVEVGRYGVWAFIKMARRTPERPIRIA